MMYFQVLVVFLTILLVEFPFIQGDAQYVDYRFVNRITKDDNIDANTICPNAGADGDACRDCYSVVHCNKNPDGSWNAQLIGSCPAGKICKNGDCVKGTQCPFPNLDFVCSTTGVFPDPGDCTKYHFCFPDSTDPNKFQNVDITCDNPNEYGYNAVTTFCSDAKPNKECLRYYVPPCKFVFDTGVIINNPTLYYECKNYTKPDGTITADIYPYQKACSNGKKFSITLETCQ